MKTNTLIFFLSLPLFIFASCKALQVDGNAKNLNIGMAKEEVLAIMGNRYESVHGSLTTDGTIVETWDYPTTTDGLSAVYKLYFVNGKLLRWDKEWLDPVSPEIVVETYGEQ